MLYFNIKKFRYKVTSITTDLKVVNPGAFIAKAGYCDVTKKRIEPYLAVKKLLDVEKEINNKIFELENEIQNYQSQDFKLLNEVQSQKKEQWKISQEIQRISLDLMDKNAKMVEYKNNAEKLANTILSIEKQIQLLSTSKAEMENSMKSGKASKVEAEGSSELLKSLDQKKNEVIRLRMMLNQNQSELDNLKNNYQIDLQKEAKLSRVLSEKESDMEPQRSRERSTKGPGDELSQIHMDNEIIDVKQREFEKFKETVIKLEKKLKKLQKREADIVDQKLEIEEKIANQVTELEILNVDRRNLHEIIALEKQEDLKNKSDIELIESSKDLTVGKLESLIKKKAKEIREIEKNGQQTHMYGFFIRMKEQFEEVKLKIEKLGEVKIKIQEILDESEQSKNIAIQNSLKKVAKKFGEYFSYFVQDAETSMKFIRTSIIKKDESQVNENGENDENDPQSQVEIEDGDEIHVLSTNSVAKGFTLGDHQYTGVSIKVGFKQRNRMQTMKELSGGEKSIVALSLLLSLNSLTNTQIYLLDEVDGALDQSYRVGLAELLTKISHGGEARQFFMTTFNQELIETADKIMKVEFKNLESKISTCPKAKAYEILQKLSNERE